MPDRKKLLQDFYAKYAPNEVLTDERLAAIENKYKDNDKQLLLDFYAKYAPDQELTDERYNAITVKYGLGKQPASPSGNGGASSSGQSQQPAQPTQPSGNGFKPFRGEYPTANDMVYANRFGRPTSIDKINDDRLISEGVYGEELANEVGEDQLNNQEIIRNQANAESQKRKEIDALNKPQEVEQPMDLRKVDVSMPTEQRVAAPVVPNVENVNAQIYSNIAPNAKESMNLAELQKRYDKEVAKVPEGTTSPDLIGIKNEIEGKYAMLEGDYLAFLQSTNKDKYENYSQRLNTINQKEEKTTDDMRFLESFRSEAINARLEADRYKIDKIKKTADLDTYQKQKELLRGEANKLQAQYQSYFNADGTPKSPADAQKANEVANRINALGEREKQLKESTGVTDEVLAELGQAYDGISQADILNKGWKPYSEIVGEEALQKEEARIRKDIAENGSMAQKSALMIMSFMDTVGSGVVAMGETPKVVADMFGYGGENGWTDALYDFSVDLNNKAAGRLKPLDTDSSLMNLADVFAKGAGNVVQLAAGSEVAGLAKAGSKIAQNAGIVASAFLMSEGQNYREALAAGISPEDAALYATMLSAAQAMTETIVPDFKYFDPSTRKSIIGAIKDGTGVKEAFKQYGKQLMVDVPKTGVKEVGEELFTEVTGDAIKEGINAYRDQEIYKDTFNPDNYKEVALTAFVTGGGLASLKRGVRELTPNEEVVPRQVGENADKIIENIVTTDPELGVEVGEEVLSLKEIVTGLQGIPSYQKLGDREKDFVVNKLMQKQDLEKSMKLAGVKDEATMKEIEKIESDIDAVYRGKKVGEEYRIEDAPEVLNVGDTIVFGKPEQNIVEEPTQNIPPVAEEADASTPQEVPTESTQAGITEEITPEGVQEEVEEKLGDPNKLQEVDALKDVESTAKALEGVDLPDNFKSEDKGGILNRENYYRLAQIKFQESEGVTNEEVFDKNKQKEQFKTQKGRDAFQKKFEEFAENSNNKKQIIAEAYHAAKADGSNPELVQAVENLLGQPNTLQDGVESQGTALQEPLSETTQDVEQKDRVANFVSEALSELKITKEETPANKEKKKSKRAEEKKLRESALNYEPSDPTSAAITKIRQFFSKGGKVSTASLMKELGLAGKKKELQKKIGLHKGDGVSIERLSEQIYADLTDEQQELVSQPEIRDMIIDVLNSESKLDMRQALIDGYLAETEVDMMGMTPQQYAEYKRHERDAEEFYEMQKFEEEREAQEAYEALFSDEVINALSDIDAMSLSEIEDKYGDAIDEDGNIDENKLNELIINEQGTKNKETAKDDVSNKDVGESQGEQTPETTQEVAPETLSKFQEAEKLFDQIQQAESGVKKRSVAEKRRAFMDANPTIKRIDDNIAKIYKQLSDNGIITKKGNCP